MKLVPALIAAAAFLAAGASYAHAADTLPEGPDTAARSPSVAAVCGSGISQVAATNRPGLCPRPLGTTLIARERHVART